MKTQTEEKINAALSMLRAAIEADVRAEGETRFNQSWLAETCRLRGNLLCRFEAWTTEQGALDAMAKAESRMQSPNWRGEFEEREP